MNPFSTYWEMGVFEEDSVIDIFEERRKTKLGEKFTEIWRRFMKFSILDEERDLCLKGIGSQKRRPLVLKMTGRFETDAMNERETRGKDVDI